MNKKIIIFLFYFLFIYFINCQQKCRECIQNQQYWCAIKQQCVDDMIKCDIFYKEELLLEKNNYFENETIKENIYWFLSKQQKKAINNNYYKIPNHCLTGIVQYESECYDETIIEGSMIRNYVADFTNYIQPWWVQPILNFTVLNDTSIDYSYFYDNWQELIVIGGAFSEMPEDIVTTKQDPLFFSYLYHVSGDYPVIIDKLNNRVIFRDVALLARIGYYKMTFTIMYPIKNETESLYQCIFIPSEQRAYQHPIYEGIFKGPHLYWGIPLLVLSFSLTTMLFICCGNKFEAAQSVHYTKDEEPRHFFLKYAKNRKYSLIEILHSLFFAPQVSLIEKCGTDIYFYLWFNKLLIVYCFICGLISLIILLPIYLSSDDYSHVYQDISITTIASIQIRFNPSSVVCLLTTLIFPVIGFIFLWRLRELARILVKGNKNYGSLYTVMVSNIPSDIKDRKTLFSYFAQRYGEASIADTHICLDLHNLQLVENESDEYEEKIKYYEEKLKKNGKRPTIRVNGICGPKKDAIEFYKNRINEIQPILQEYRKLSNIHSTSYGFVTFTSIEKAEQCIKEHEAKFCGIPIPQWLFDPLWDFSVEKAPEADDVLYENLTYGKVSRFIRSILTNFIIFAALCVVYTATYVVSLYNTWRFQNISAVNEWISAHGNFFIINTIFDLIPEAISAIHGIFGAALHFATNFEKHHTKAAFRMSMLRKTTFYMILNILIVGNIVSYWRGILFVFFWADEPFRNYLYFFNQSASGMMFLLVLLMTIAKGVELGFGFIGMIIQLWRKGKIIRPSFDYEGAYGFKITLLTIVLIYGSTIPLLFLFMFVFFIYSYFMDKYFIMFLCAKSSDSDGAIVTEVADIISAIFGIYPIAILFMLPNTFIMWQTYIIFIPATIVISVLLRLLKTIMKKKLKKRIIIGVVDDEEDEQDIEIGENKDLENEEIVEEKINTEKEEIQENIIQNEIEEGKIINEQEDFDSDTSKGSSKTFLATNTAQSGNVGKRILLGVKRFILGDERVLSIEEIESMKVDLRQLSARYQHPLLRRLRRKKEEKAIEKANSFNSGSFES